MNAFSLKEGEVIRGEVNSISFENSEMYGPLVFISMMQNVDDRSWSSAKFSISTSLRFIDYTGCDVGTDICIIKGIADGYRITHTSDGEVPQTITIQGPKQLNKQGNDAPRKEP